MYQTLKDSGYIYKRYDREYKEHHLFNPITKQIEVWFANKYHASYGIIYKNTHLEFARSLGYGTN